MPDNTSKTSKTVDRHIAYVCKVAGLGVMEQVYEIILDREEVPGAGLLKLDAARVHADYEAWIGPAIDGLEKTLMDDRG